MRTKQSILEHAKTNGKMASARRPDKVAGSNDPDTAKLSPRIAAYAQHDGTFELRIPDLHASRYSRINKECIHTLRLPCLSIVAQGAKTVIAGQEVFEYDAFRMLVYSVALPVAAQITQASHSEPYLALRLDIDPHKIAELVLKVFPYGLPPVQERSAGICQLNRNLPWRPRPLRRKNTYFVDKYVQSRFAVEQVKTGWTSAQLYVRRTQI